MESAAAGRSSFVIQLAVRLSAARQNRFCGDARLDTPGSSTGRGTTPSSASAAAATVAAAPAVAAAVPAAVPRLVRTTLEALELAGEDVHAALGALPVARAHFRAHAEAATLATATAAIVHASVQAAAPSAATATTAAATAAAAGPAPARAATSPTTAAHSLHLDGPVLALALVVLNPERAHIPLANASLSIEKLRHVAEQVLTAVVGLDEAEALLIMPPQHLAFGHLCQE